MGAQLDGLLRLCLFAAIFMGLVELLGCAMPVKESMRPRGVDLYGGSGQSRFYGETQRDWNIGANVHFDIYYEDDK